MRTITRKDLRELGEDIGPEMQAGAPPEPLPPDPPTPEEDCAVEAEPAAAPPPPAFLSAEKREELSATVARLRAREGELYENRAALEDRTSIAAEEVRAAVSESRRRKFDALVTPSPENEAAAAAAKARAKAAYDLEADLLDMRELYPAAIAEVSSKVVAATKHLEHDSREQLKAKLRAGCRERSDLLLRCMAESLALWELDGGLPPAPNCFGELLNLSIGFDRSVTDEARKIREAGGLL